MRKITFNIIQIILLLLLCSLLITACGDKDYPDEKVIPESTIVEELPDSNEIEGEKTSSFISSPIPSCENFVVIIISRYRHS